MARIAIGNRVAVTVGHREHLDAVIDGCGRDVDLEVIGGYRKLRRWARIVDTRDVLDNAGSAFTRLSVYPSECGADILMT